MKDCNYKPSGELQGDTSGLPDRGTSTGFGDNAATGGMTTDSDATNSMGKITGSTKSDGESTSFGGDDRV